MKSVTRAAFPIANGMPTGPATKIMLNVGAGLDIPTGKFLRGKHGEMILNGGLAIVEGIAGKGNNFKSTLLEYKMHRAASRVVHAMDTNITTHDTEENKDEHRITSLYQKLPEFKERDLFYEGVYSITGKSQAKGEQWWDKLREFLEAKEKNRKALMVETPFMDRDRVSRIKIMQPTFSLIDSFSEFETSDVTKILEDNAIGEAGGNMVYMRAGLAKTRLIMEYPTVGIANQHYLLTAAHFGKEIPIASGPYAPPPEKKMNSMAPGEKIKGVPDKYYYLVHWVGLATGSTMMINQGTKGCEYPGDEHDKQKGHNDLWYVPVKTLRNKFGTSSWVTGVIVSQTDGVQPTLTEFHFLRESRFGLVGNDQNYAVALLPECKLSRSTVRFKIDRDPMLRRAINICSELYQMSIFHRDSRNDIIEPEELYDKIKAAGYDWDMILGKTRGWWKPDNEVHPLLFLSTMDILNMAQGTYHPYWLMEDKKTIKPEYIFDEPYEFY